MNIIEQFVRKPVLTSSLCLFLIFAGIFALFKMPLRLFPNVEKPLITIDTSYIGASQDVMEGYVTSLLETALNGIANVDYITSSSATSNSHIDVHLKLGTNTDLALTSVMSKISSVKNFLPAKADDPVIATSSSDDAPVMMLAFTIKNDSREKLADELRRKIVPEIESINGVSQAVVLGGAYAMRIWLNPLKMLYYNVSATEVQNALNQQNIQSSSGNIAGNELSFDIDLKSSLNTVEQFSEIVVKKDQAKLVKLKDIADIKLGAMSDRVSAIYNGTLGVMMRVEALPTANPLSIAKDVNKLLPRLKQILPSNIKLSVSFDTSDYIKHSIMEVLYTIIASTVIVSLVIYLLFGSLRVATIPIIVIPLSLLGTCFFMLYFNYSTNVITLLAMVLAVSLVVDDAIVVVENIYRHIEEGCGVFQSAIIATKEIVAPVIAMTWTLGAVYAPLMFVGGITGQLFSEFALTLVVSMVISGILALSLTPMMSARLLKPINYINKSHSCSVRINHAIIQYMQRLSIFYVSILHKLLPHYRKISGVIILIIIANIMLYYHLPKELEPYEDQSFLQIIGNAPSVSSSTFLKKQTEPLKNIFAKFSEIDNYIYINGIPSFNQYMAFVSLKDWSERTRSSVQLQPILQQAISNNILDLQSIVLLPSSLPGNDGMSISFVLRTNDSYNNLYQQAQELLQQARKSGKFLFIKSDINYDKPLLTFEIKRDVASILNVSISKINETLDLFLSNNKTQQFNMNGRVYNVIVQVGEKFRLSPHDLDLIYVKSDNGKLVPLSSLVIVNTKIAPVALKHFQKMNSITIEGEMQPQYFISDGLAFLENTTKEIMNKNVVYDFAGKSRQYLQEGNRILWAFVLAVFIIFLALSIQFESYRDPVIIIFGSVPTAIFGALCFLSLGLGTLNIYTEIGLLTLIGLISKHGILLVNLANKLQYQKICSSSLEAIITAGKLRLRPIIMTTLAMVLGSLPLLLATGPGNQSRFALGVVISSGMFVGTLCTLFLIPSLYLLINKSKNCD